MASISDLPHLLRLLEDEDHSTRQAVTREMLSFGDLLDEELARMHPPMTRSQRFLVNAIIEPHHARPQSTDGALNARFANGRLIVHKKYRYRGVIVASDPMCLAEHQWYMSNSTQPDIHQPWYHILVDESWAITYAAESNLELDPEPGLISHPVLGLYFRGFRHGTYLRNRRPWMN